MVSVNRNHKSNFAHVTHSGRLFNNLYRKNDEESMMSYNRLLISTPLCAKATQLRSCSWNSNAFPGQQSKLRDHGCAKRLGLTLFPCLFTIPRSRHVFPKASCTFPFYASVTTHLPFLILTLFIFLRLPYSICLFALCHVTFQRLGNFFRSSKEFLSDVFVCHVSLFAYP